VKSNIAVKPITTFDYLNVDEYFEGNIVKPEQFKLIICIYKNPNSNIKILLDNLEIILDHFEKANNKIIIIGDLNINFLKNNWEKKHLESLLNMYGLEVVIDRPTRIQNGVKSAIDQIILNTKMLRFKTEILETNLSDHFGQILTLYEDQLPEIGSKFRKNIVKYMTVNNEENIQYLNFLPSKEDWMNIYRQHDVNIAYKEFIHIFTYYLDIAIPFKKVKMNKA
jgi:hypothetical protein